MPVGELVLDGEAVAQDANGLPDFWALRSAEKACNAVLYAFDLLVLNGKDPRPTALAYRRDLLEEVVADPLGCLAVSERYDGDRTALLRHASPRLGEHRLEADGYELPLGSVRRLAQDQVP